MSERLVPIDEVLNLPDVEWLIDGVLPNGGLCLLVGKPEVGKSFLALDWALHVATGTEWAGRDTKQGAVIYVAAEGYRGMGARVGAWLGSHDTTEKPPVYFFGRALHLLRFEEAKLLSNLSAESIEKPPRLVVIDTLSRSMPGANENSAEAMTMFVESLGVIQRDTGATMLVLHHFDKKGEAERGHSSLDGAVDVKMYLRHRSDSLMLRCMKMKDGAHFEDINMRLRTTGKSCIVQPSTTLWKSQSDSLENVF